MTKIYDQNRIYAIVETRESSEYPENQVSVVGSGNSDKYYYDIYGTIKDNAIFEYNTKTLKVISADDSCVRNHTNKTIHVICSRVQRGDSEATLGPNEEKWFDTDDGFLSVFDITILNVKTYNKSTNVIRGFVY